MTCSCKHDKHCRQPCSHRNPLCSTHISRQALWNTSNFASLWATKSVNNRQQGRFQLLKSETGQTKQSLEEYYSKDWQLAGELSEGTKMGSSAWVPSLHWNKQSDLHKAVLRHSCSSEMLQGMKQKLPRGAALNIKQWNRERMSESRK